MYKMALNFRGFWVNFCKNKCCDCSEINISQILQKFTAKFTAFLRKIHRICFPTFTESDLNSQEMTNKKDVTNTR